MKKSEMQISYFNLFKTLFLINAFTFGGGYTIIPVIKDRFTKDLGIIDESSMTEIISLANSVPGALAIATSYLVGHKTRGYIGGIIAVIASVLPCILCISALFLIYQSFISNIHAIKTLEAIAAMVSAILVVTVFKMLLKIDKKYIPLFILSFIAARYLAINVAIILLISAIISLIVERQGK